MNSATIKNEKEELNKKLTIFLTQKEFNLIELFAKKDYLTIGRYGRKILLTHCAEMLKLEKNSGI